MKKLFALFAILAVLSFFPVSTLASSTLLNNIVSYWKLDGNSTDAAGTNNGTDTAITYSTANGIINQGAGFNGSSSIIKFGTFSPSISGNYTVNLWFKLSSNSSGANYELFSTRTTSEYGTDLSVNYPTFGLHGDIGNGTAWLTTAADYSFTFTTGTWYMVTAVYTTTGWTYYVNGSSVASGSYSGTPLFSDSSHSLSVGAYVTTGGVSSNFFPGAIDETGLWSRALTSTEVSQLYNSGAGLQYPFGSAAPTVSPFNLIWW